ncbi:beta-ketoacyl synthase N-terminal-like domain-containing protein [Capnocytophaga haemolytica]
MEKIAITGMGSVSALGSGYTSVGEAYANDASALRMVGDVPQGVITDVEKECIAALRAENPLFTPLDPSVLYAMFAARQAVRQAGWQGVRFGVNIGSSRGATSLFEAHYQRFLSEGSCLTQASPTTTLGNIATWVAQDLGAGGFELSHSITCSTALHGVANAVAWLKSGMEEHFVVGGSEAPLTPFTIAQVKALKIYSTLPMPYPCRAMDEDKRQNSMVLGEGAAVFCLERGERSGALAYITGLGFATERLTHSVSLSKEGFCLQESMRRALESASYPEIDMIITHCTGTVKGDRAELAAIRAVFGTDMPLLTNNKWKIGHTYGASGALNLEMAIHSLCEGQFYAVPYLNGERWEPRKIHNVLINAVGFGGNAISVVVSRG